MSSGNDKERLQKVLARSGWGSRREIEAQIRRQAIVLNDRAAQLGDKVQVGDRVSIDGHRLRVVSSDTPGPRVLAYHKPEGEVCSRQENDGLPTVYRNLPPLRGARWLSVGRLDVNTSGLLLFTDDGELVNALTHPSSEVEREYAVRVLGEIPDAGLDRLREGVTLDGQVAAFERIEFRGGEGANRWYHVILKEGRKREVRRLWETQGVRVSRLIRVRYGSQQLDRALRAGRHRRLTRSEVRQLAADGGIRIQQHAKLRVQREHPRRRRR